MSRPLEFRRWDKDLGFMQPVAIPRDGDMQFTGLLDKNGVKVFEGDVLRSDWNGHTFAVEWDNSYGGWVYETDCDTTSGRYAGTEVIGNVHEHGELLTGDGDN